VTEWTVTVTAPLSAGLLDLDSQVRLSAGLPGTVTVDPGSGTAQVSLTAEADDRPQAEAVAAGQLTVAARRMGITFAGATTSAVPLDTAAEATIRTLLRGSAAG
jgi:hypothetical protein